MGERHYALLGEVEEDATTIDAVELQIKLEAALSRLNEEHARYIHAPLVSSSGFPEFVGVLHHHTPIYLISRSLAEACYPLGVHIAVARGEITTGLESKDAEAMEGPAYDEAGELLYRARKEERLLLLDSGDPKMDGLLNALMLLLHRNFQHWTERQWEVVALYRELGRQSEVAARLNISQQSVSSTLAGAGWKVLAEVESTLGRVLDDPIRELLGEPR